MNEPDAETSKRRWRRRFAIAAQIGLGLGVGLFVTELVFAARDQHAFPHVNFYVPDTELGARLEPGAKMAFRLGNNPLTHIAVNSRGYRAPEWPESPSPSGHDEILVVGDSQVFGLGVDDDQTFSAVLAGETGRTVINAGVPTYGPPEYLATTRELLQERPIGTVVYVLNFLNDPFELDRPNRERHAIWDGWAVQIETAPREVFEFPGRRWLMSKSHTIYAARRWWHSSDEAWFARVDQGLPSEGVWADLLVESEVTPMAIDRAQLEATLLIVDAETRVQKLLAKLADINEDLERAQRELDRHPRRSQDDEILEARPGAIIRDRYSEAARSIEVTAEVYQAALERRREHVQTRHRIESLESQRDELLADIDGVALPSDSKSAKKPNPKPKRPPSVFADHFDELESLCEQHGAELLVVMLPFDVQVSHDEWAKYGVEDGPDMAPTLVLIDDAIASASQRGIRAFDSTPVLRDAEPGAFLDADIHMTPKGHAALGRALAEALAYPSMK